LPAVETALIWLVLSTIACDPLQGDDGTEDTALAIHFEDTAEGNDDDGGDGSDDGDGGNGDGDGDGGNDDGSDSGDDGGDDGTNGDFDGDGWTVDDGDCDDYDEFSNPAEPADACDGADNDCDGRTDEDFDEDEYEPNDDAGYDLGDLTGVEDVVYGFLYPSTEWDAFEFYLDDGWWDVFGVDVSLAGVPFEADLAITLYMFDEEAGSWTVMMDADEAGLGGAETLSYGGSSFSDDTGAYAITISSTTGESCSESYALEIAG
jgi:hypothetical protein